MFKLRNLLYISIVGNIIFAIWFLLFNNAHVDQIIQQPKHENISENKPLKKQQAPVSATLSNPAQSITQQQQEIKPIHKPQQIDQSETLNEPTSSEDNLSQLRFLNSCYNDNDCGYQNQDPRQVDYQIGQEIKDELHNLMAMWKNSEITATELEQAALDSLNNPDGHVQQAALDLLAQLPPSAANFDAIIEITEDNYDAMIVEQLMDELYRYMPQGYGAEIDQTFTNLIITGAPYASQTAAQNIVPFLNPNNIDTYKDTLSKIPADSKKAKLLKGAIEEFELQQSGGQR